MDTTTCIRDMSPIASAELSGPGSSTCGTLPSLAATWAAASPSSRWFMGRNTAVRPYFSQACAAAAAKTPAFLSKPGQRRRAKQMYFPSGSAPTALSAASTSSAGAAGRVSAGSEARIISGSVTPKRASSSMLSGSRSVMASTQELSTFRVLATPPGRFTGPMPQPYIMTLQPRRLAARRVKR